MNADIHSFCVTIVKKKLLVLLQRCNYQLRSCVSVALPMSGQRRICSFSWPGCHAPAVLTSLCHGAIRPFCLCCLNVPICVPASCAGLNQQRSLILGSCASEKCSG